MTTLREAAQQALEALEWSWGGEPMGTLERDAITALRAALAQQAEPPVDDPHRDHWVAIAEAAQKIAASTECGPAEAEALCAALDRLTAAALAQQTEPVPMPPFPPVSQWNRGCAVCGAHGNATGYVCPRSDCPTKVTCGGVA